MVVSPKGRGNIGSLNIRTDIKKLDGDYIKLFPMDAEEEKQLFNQYVSPANPIISKKVLEEEQGKIKFQQIRNSDHNLPQKLDNNRFLGEDLSDDEIEGRITLFNAYPLKCLIFQKWDNTGFRKRGKKQYFSSVFTNMTKWPQLSQISQQTAGLTFGSAEESMNLFAVFQIGPQEFDLILQNDINTSGYTQWFHFSVKNAARNQQFKFNIVNLYKTRSLYSCGMKPVVMSKKSGKGWQRAGTSIFYAQNQINFEYSRRSFYTLSFQHTFLSENDETIFAHSFPYTSIDLKQKIRLLDKNPRVQVRSIGKTCLKNNLPIIQFSQEDSNPNKKAIVFMARQHPGETVGSYIMDGILTELSKNSPDAEFLLWRFNIYCLPMVNVDGVELGNYRGNSLGFDLNRSWDRQNLAKVPEVTYIKKEIKAINKKFPIELILDLHGHSRKMGSFFYGNPFGKNTGLFAYVASKMSPNVSFENSTFNKEKSEKITTARIVLGNIIKDSGCFYTYQTSFYGSNINGKKTHYTIENLRDLGRNLIAASSKTFLEIQKEEKSLKESPFLKEIRKEIIKMKETTQNLSSSGSDSEAEVLTRNEMKIKQTEVVESIGILKKSPLQPSQELQKNRSVQVQVGTDDMFCEEKVEKRRVQAETPSKIGNFRRNRTGCHLVNSSQKYSLLQIGFEKSTLEEEQTKETSSQASDPLNRKHFLMQKLRVFGETFIEPNPRDKNKQTQTFGEPLNIMGKGKFGSVSHVESPMKATMYRKRRNKNKSLIIRLDQKQKIPMSDIVRVNRLEYKKIKRDSLNELSGRTKMKYQLLPLIN